MTWLITGGAGYIGAHIVRAMTEAGERTVVYDDLSTGVAERVPAEVPLVRGSTLDADRVARTLADHDITGVVHLAAKKQVGESVDRPLHYYHENVEGLRVLLEAVTTAEVPSFLFSSSAAVYGMPDVDLVTEETPCRPLSPYGETKLAGEWLVRAAGRAAGLSTASLRYFNVAGAAAPELADTGVFNLIPMVFEKLTEGAPPRIFGDDYPTPDGTCVRDYIHVVDLAEAHVTVARALSSSPGTDLTLNIGRGEGVSVREMIDRINGVTGYNRPPVVTPRRPGDPARVVASADRIATELGWHAKYDVQDMITSAWEGWVRTHPGAARS
ncbi:UDP-glucose 4-epimerase GalE [Streptomyces pluripotens]|uniref:UDP-glucose 4-epimerase n=1 Tax=Streptomyces pluripotens TaxID=1355015 RepID=A0A221NY61_9ACTN|nr:MULTISPECIES: UDP-glucose 4-epimerase GalE [Streptomyces]ARP70510.1 UDP-glucose 4-epimerase GalE [Streptomyces pluripotens]ASN24766.1 UDP-glucose 4-epimerase GalE [Streptomyces pluripotens]KIE28928.1 UDP-glucose 4-epimerase [Streptomyces sp. MUSC 125]MCH0560549.1 UDP-glucose 4-epimerase GalE [Streptomyces sp. MUM 16J]